MVTEQPQLPLEADLIERTIPSAVNKLSHHRVDSADSAKDAIAAPTRNIDPSDSNTDSNNIVTNGPGGMASAQAESSSTASKYTIENVPKMLAEGKKKAALSDWDASLDLLSTAVEVMNAKYGELAPECADAYFIYGQTLLTAAVSRSNALGGIVSTAVEDDLQQDAKLLENVQKPANRFAIEGDDADWDDEGEDEVDEEIAEGEAGENGEPDAEPSEEQPQATAPGGSSSTEAAVPEKDDMELAFEVLDMCRVIYSKMEDPEAMAKLGDVHLMLGDIALDGGHYKEAIKDYVLAISLKQLVNAPHRELAEAHYKLSLPLEYEAQYDEAIKHVNAVVEAVEGRIALLKQQLKDAGIPTDEKGKGNVFNPEGETDPAKSEIAEMQAVLVEMAEKIQDLTRQKTQLRPGFLNASNEETPDSSNITNTSTNGESAVVHDLAASGLVKSKRGAPSTNAPSATADAGATGTKRKTDEDAVEAGEAKKAKTYSS